MGRWISCGAGWYPLLIELHADLVALDHDYVVEQVKEKFGTLRFDRARRLGHLQRPRKAPGSSSKGWNGVFSLWIHREFASYR